MNKLIGIQLFPKALDGAMDQEGVITDVKAHVISLCSYFFDVFNIDDPMTLLARDPE